MKYNIISIADIHWGSINPKEQLKSLEFLFEFIEDSIENDLKIDLIVLLGDYFDVKLSLNSQEGIYSSQWFDRLYSVCELYGIKIRIVQGTREHDNDQLDNLSELQDKNGFFKLFKHTEIEETLDGLTCIYCPDETIETSKYESIYMDQIMEIKDIGFFHGSFDLVYGDLLEVKPELMTKNNVIYRYELWSPQFRGPLIAGHWHDGKQYEELYYCGSPFRWKFKEDEPKGFLFITYDTDDYSYHIEKIINPLCASYITYEVYSNTFQKKEDYAKIIEEIHNILDELSKSSLKNKLRIIVYIVDEKVENDIFLSALRQEIINYKNCKITIKNKLKDKKKKEKIKRTKEEESKYNFIFEKGEPQDKIHEFVLSSTNNEIDIPMDYIISQVKKYI